MKRQHFLPELKTMYGRAKVWLLWPSNARASRATATVSRILWPPLPPSPPLWARKLELTIAVSVKLEQSVQIHREYGICPFPGCGT